MRKRNLARVRPSGHRSQRGKNAVSPLKALRTAAAIVFAGCTAGADSAQQQAAAAANDTGIAPAATPIASQLAAEYFGSIKTTGSCPNDTTCVYVQTFPGDASREITLIVSPGRRNTPSTGNSGSAAVAGLFGFSYKSSADADSTVTIDMNYFVSPETMSNRGTRVGQASQAGIVRFASLSSPSALQADGGAGIAWTEVGKKGADVAIGAIIDKAKEGTGKVGGAAGRLGTIYSIASLLSDVSESLDLSKQHTKWIAELELLENCAANPTNPLAQKDPGYSDRTVKKIQSARSELKEVTGVRYLNKMTEGTAGLTPVTSVMSVGLKDGFFWSEQTLGDYSENTIMREARVAVVKCSDEGADSKGNLTYTYDCTNGTGNNSHRVQLSIVGNIEWKWKVGVLYRPEGTYVYKHTETFGGKCVATGTASGSITPDQGSLMIMRTAAEEQNAGYGYDGRFVGPQFVVNYTASCRPAYSLPGSLHILPGMRGPKGATGMITGQTTGMTCVGGVGGPAIMKWSFAVPDAK